MSGAAVEERGLEMAEDKNGTGIAPVDEAFNPFEEGERDPQAIPGADDAALVARARQEKADGQTADAADRIAALFAKMHTDRKALLAIVRACEAPCDAAGVARAATDAASGVSVYAPETLRRLLEEAGALVCVDAAGEPYPEEAGEPKTVVVDGVECLEPAEAPEPHWLATSEGKAALLADKPLSRIELLFEEKADYLPIFKRVLMLCAQEGGTATKAINAAVDNDPLVQSPRYYASYFTERLEGCDALAWDGVWKTTDTGLEALEMLADVVDEGAAA